MRCAVGGRVAVPLGSRTVVGIVVELVDDAGDAGEAALKPIAEAIDAEPFLPPDVVALARWTAEYYAAGQGETILAALPPKTRGGRADAHKTVRVAAVSTLGLEALASDGCGAKSDAVWVNTAPGAKTDAGGAKLSARQREALAVMSGSPHGLAAAALSERGITPAILARLAARGLVVVRREPVQRDPFESATFAGPALEANRQLTGEQRSALGRLDAMADGSFRVALLHGVTGSGKTEVYLRLSAAVAGRGRTVLMLVPEIALTPAVSALFRQAFGDRVAVQHSGLSDGERHDQWHRVRRGEVDIVVGTRSAIFAPLPRLGLVIVDEEHDGSYKQEESPRYNARDLAIVRSQQAGALAVLGSATPSMESYHRATAGKYELVALERRVLDRPLAAVTVVDMREEYAAVGPDVILSRALSEAIGERIARREQALVLLNRRGYATSVFCRQCGGTVDCPHCSVSLVVHGAGGARHARCHYCNYSTRVPVKCPHCAAPYMEQAGFGTERVEAEVRRAWPAARVARLDRDAIRRKGAAGAVLSKLKDGLIDVLVGTQMIAKGHDFPKVTLVGVVSADVGLGLADFRAAERTFQLLTQVAGRAGRGETPGEAIVQTIYPGHYSIQLACTQEYRAFFEREQEFRRKMRYPPFLSLINVIVNAKTFSGAMDDAAQIAGRLDDGRAPVRVLGPAPAALGRLRGEYRAQLLLKGTNRKAMRQALASALAARPDIARRTIVDIDPLSVL
jgi:primosomal protein N' (replication factor Y)